MSFPAIFRRLFEKDGAGPLLRKEILPPHADTHGAKGGDPITPESIGALPASASGGAASADVAVKLKTARAIDGVNFDGSAAITHYAECSTAAATAAKVVSLAGFTLVKGAKVTVRFTVTNTAANPTLNVNKTGAKAIQYRNAAITAGALAANRTYTFVYDGSSWELVGDLDSTVVGGIIPIGGIILWSGTEANVPTGWALCNGQNGTPDLRDRMIMGAGTTYKTGAKGGAATHAHSVSGTVGATTLSEAQLAANLHDDYFDEVKASLTGGGGAAVKNSNIDSTQNWQTRYAGGSQPHTHPLSGASGQASSLPPYYALAFIMRVA